MRISILVCTYGEARWPQLAAERAVPSAIKQGAYEVRQHHDPNGTIATVRNHAAQQALGDWLVFLDADDELALGYISAMWGAWERAGEGAERTLFTPRVSYIHARGRRQQAKFWPVVPFEDANWMVIGTMISKQLFCEMGGFRNYGDPPGSNAYEDWGLWALCQREGATVVKVPDAVYVAHVEESSRHRGATHETRLGWHFEIGRDLFPERYPEDWMETSGRPRAARRAATARGRRR